MIDEIPTCGAVIFDHNGNVLLVQHLEGADHLTGTFGLPSGKLEEGESALEAIVREVREETGLVLDKKEFFKLPTIYRASIPQKDSIKNFIWDVFMAHSSQNSLTESSETRPQWVEKDKIKNLSLLPNVWNAIQEADQINSKNNL